MNALSIIGDVYLETVRRENMWRNTYRDSYPFIPVNMDDALSTIEFASNLIKAPETNMGKFLDVGCGIGNVLALAEYCRIPDIYGIEIDESLKRRALYNSVPLPDTLPHSEFGSDSPLIFNLDAFDFKFYNEMDIIYYYCPMQKLEKQLRLEALIEKKMKGGALLIAFMKQDMTITKSKRFRKVSCSYPIWQKGLA